MVFGKKSPSKVTINELPSETMVHPLGESKTIIGKSTLLSGAVIVVLGIVSGFLLSGGGSDKINSGSGGTGSADTNKVVGSSDTKTFPDTAEGTLEAGGVDGEGTHHLVRPGGVSQTVYLTSSVLDLKEFEGKKVKIWGATFSGQKAGWLMDVGKVEVME